MTNATANGLSVAMLFDVKSIAAQFWYGTGYGLDDVVDIVAVMGVRSLPSGVGCCTPVNWYTPPLIEPALLNATRTESRV
jgi:hypothetical protein